MTCSIRIVPLVRRTVNPRSPERGMAPTDCRLDRRLRPPWCGRPGSGPPVHPRGVARVHPRRAQRRVRPGRVAPPALGRRSVAASTQRALSRRSVTTFAIRSWTPAQSGADTACLKYQCDHRQHQLGDQGDNPLGELQIFAGMASPEALQQRLVARSAQKSRPCWMQSGRRLRRRWRGRALARSLRCRASSPGWPMGGFAS